VILAVVGVFNNLFGFTGITAFARYLVAPLMILWMLYLVIKGFADIPSEALSASPPVGELGPLSFLSGIGLAIGAVMWGNEPDTWRFGQPRFFWPLVPYAVALGIGLVLFVIGGWMMAEISGAGPFDFGPAFKSTVEYSLFGALLLGAVVATVMQIAINDGNYYEMTNGGQNIVGHVHGWKRWYTCLVTAAVAAVVTWWFPHIENGFFKVAGWTAIALPSATVVMCVDQFLLPRWLGLHRSVERIPEWRAAATGNWPGIVAVLLAVLFGAWGLALFPGQTSAPSLGLVPVEAWLLAAVLYLILVAAVRPMPNAKALLGFARHLRQAAGPAPPS
jgi:hypothetical protein